MNKERKKVLDDDEEMDEYFSKADFNMRYFSNVIFNRIKQDLFLEMSVTNMIAEEEKMLSEKELKTSLLREKQFKESENERIEWLTSNAYAELRLIKKIVFLIKILLNDFDVNKSVLFSCLQSLCKV